MAQQNTETEIPEEEIEKFIENNHESLTNAELAGELGISVSEVQSYLKKLDLSEKIDSVGVLPSRARKVETLSISTERKQESETFEELVDKYSDALRILREKNYKEALEALREIKNKIKEEKELLRTVENYISICKKMTDQSEETQIELESYENYIDEAIINLNNRDFEVSEKNLNRAKELASTTEQKGEVFFITSNLEALRENKESSLEALKEALEYDSEFKYKALNDSDFDILHEEEEFEELFQKD